MTFVADVITNTTISALCHSQCHWCNVSMTKKVMMSLISIILTWECSGAINNVSACTNGVT